MHIIKDNSAKIFRINGVVEERLEYLKKQREIIYSELSRMPKGNIIVAPGSTVNSYRYYLRETPQEGLGKYLDKNKSKEKQMYATKKYKEILIKSIEEEIKKLEKVKKLQLEDSIVAAYSKTHAGIKKLVSPLEIDDETYVKLWEAKEYQGLGFSENDTTAFYSDRNERMRSKSEVLIANTLLRNYIPYKYECPITRRNGEKLYPDFTILDIKNRKEIYWEHLGRMGDAGYVMKNIWKLDEYKKCDIYLGVNLFVTYENGINALGTNEIINTLKAFM